MSKYYCSRRNACFLLGFLILVWVYISGKDINWDFLNYHLYGPSLFVDGRWEKDYFAGSVQSYLNPVSYVPLYLMVQSALPDRIVAIVLSLPALLLVWLLWRIAEEIIFENNAAISLKFMAVLLAITTALWLIVIGSTFNDSLACALVLGTLHLVLHFGDVCYKKKFLAGVVLGAAVGIKLTNGAFVLPMLIALIWLSRSMKAKNILVDLIFFSIGVGSGFLLLHGYWSWKLWQEFGNPFFPFFNGIFKSPDFSYFNLHDKRFMGSGVLGVLTLPVEMPGINSWVYNETRAPEIKPLVFAAVFSIGIISFVLKKKKPSENMDVAIAAKEKLLAVSFFVFASYMMWALSSRIGRYALPMWVLLGIVIPGWLSFIFPMSVARVLTASLLAIQLFLNFNADISHWTPVQWGGSWFNPIVPAALKDRPHTILTASLQSYSALVPYFHPETRWSNIYGQNSLKYGREMPERLRSILDKGDVVALAPILIQTKSDAEEIGFQEKSLLSGIFLPFGLSVADDKCWIVRIPQVSINPWSFSREGSPQDQIMRACPMKKISEQEKALAIMRAQRYDKIFEEIEIKCPQNFSPPGAVSSMLGEEVGRYYFNNSTYLYSDGGAILARPPRQMLRNVVALIDPEKSELKSEIICYENPEKLYLE